MSHLRYMITLLAGSLFLNGCGFVSTDPDTSNLRAEWTVNEGQNRTLGQDVPVILRLTVINRSERKVRIPLPHLKPFLVASQPVEVRKWTSPDNFPGMLRPGETWQGSWLPDATFAPGTYSVRLSDEAEFEVIPCEFTIVDEPTELPLRLFYSHSASLIRGEPEPLIEELRNRLDGGDESPEIRLQLADLLASAGRPLEAQAHYRRFASEVFGPGKQVLPAWLEACIERDATESGEENP